MRRRGLRGLAALVIAATVPAGPGTAAGTADIRLDSKDGVRTAIVRPAPQRPAPTVVVLHGALADGERTARRSGFAEAAAGRGFAAVFPDGINRQWNDGRESGPVSSVDDVGFLRRLIVHLARTGIADPAHIYLAGISNGGMMTFRMLCEAADLIAGAGAVIANMPAAIGDGCRPARPVALAMLNGTADPLVPYAGGGVGFAGRRGEVWSAERSAAFVARRNGCTDPPHEAILAARPDEATKIVRIDWSPCSTGRTVTLYRIEGGGHQLYGRPSVLPAVLGPGTQQVSAPDLILEMFAAAAR